MDEREFGSARRSRVIYRQLRTHRTEPARAIMCEPTLVSESRASHEHQRHHHHRQQRRKSSTHRATQPSCQSVEETLSQFFGHCFSPPFARFVLERDAQGLWNAKLG
jgi:hypothetical protein